MNLDFLLGRIQLQCYSRCFSFEIVKNVCSYFSIGVCKYINIEILVSQCQLSS